MSSSMHHKSSRRGRKGQSQSLIMSPRYNQLILPERFRTRLETTYNFYVPASNMSATAGNYMDVKVNSIYQPFNTSYVVNTAVNAYSMHGSPVQGYTGTQSPMGYSTFAALYSLYKVLRYRISVTCQPQNTGDTVALCIFPIGAEEIPSTSTAAVNLNTFQGQPKNKSKIVENGAPSKTNTLTISQPVHELLGKRASQWLDIDGTATGSGPADPGYVGIFAQIMDGATNTSPIVFSVILHQDVEFTDLLQPIN